MQTQMESRGRTLPLHLDAGGGGCMLVINAMPGRFTPGQELRFPYMWLGMPITGVDGYREENISYLRVSNLELSRL
jgi:hypothetical protein